MLNVSSSSSPARGLSLRIPPLSRHRSSSPTACFLSPSAKTAREIVSTPGLGIYAEDEDPKLRSNRNTNCEELEKLIEKEHQTLASIDRLKSAVQRQLSLVVNPAIVAFETECAQRKSVIAGLDAKIKELEEEAQTKYDALDKEFLARRQEAEEQLAAAKAP